MTTLKDVQNDPKKLKEFVKEQEAKYGKQAKGDLDALDATIRASVKEK